MARPTDLTSELIEKARGYLDICKDESQQEVIGMSAKGTELYKNKAIVNLPSIAGLALYLDVARSSLYLWKESNQEFSDILEKILAEQEKRLIDKGLSGDYNPSITKLALGKHGYHEKVDTDLTTKGEKITVDEKSLALAKKYEEELKKGL